jgi:hypothetical protein
MHLISADILDLFRKLGSFRMWGNGMYINAVDKRFYTTQYQEAFVKYVQNEYCAKHWHVPVNKLEHLQSSNIIPYPKASGFCESSIDPYDLSSDDKECLTPNNVAEMTLGQRNCAAHLLTAGKLNLNSPPNPPKIWAQLYLNVNVYRCNQMENSSTFWIPDITDWWGQQEAMHKTSADLSNLARDIFSNIQHGVVVEPSCSHGHDLIS